MIKEILLVGLGGGAGSILRYLGTVYSNKLFPTVFPVGTFFVNILGCFLLGVLTGLIEHRGILDIHHRLLFVTGFCGGFTTFSTFSAESVALIESGNMPMGIIYIVAGILFGLLALWTGILLTR